MLVALELAAYETDCVVENTGSPYPARLVDRLTVALLSAFEEASAGLSRTFDVLGV